MHYLFIVNPIAGNGYANQVWEQLLPIIAKQQIAYDVQITKSKNQIPHLVNKLLSTHNQSNNVMVAVGGDGTVSEVLNALMTSKQTTCPLAVIPCGRTNNFARSIKMSSQPLDAWQQITNVDESQPVFVGHYQDQIKNQEGYFVSSLGIGFDARINSRINQSNKGHRQRIGTFAFLKQALATLYNQQPFSLDVDDGEHQGHFKHAFIALTCKTSTVGQAVVIDPQASSSHPSVSLVVVERKNWLQTLASLWKLIHGRIIRSRFTHCFRSDSIRLSSDSLEFMQIDSTDQGNHFTDLQIDCVSYPFWGIN